VKDRIGDQLGAGAAFVEVDPGKPRQMHQAQPCGHRPDDQRDAEDLFAFDA
jgi:hypothetical protein